jgi:hypothetical protein
MAARADALLNPPRVGSALKGSTSGMDRSVPSVPPNFCHGERSQVPEPFPHPLCRSVGGRRLGVPGAGPVRPLRVPSMAARPYLEAPGGHGAVFQATTRKGRASREADQSLA